MDITKLLEKVKQNLILEHSADDTLIEGYITAAVSYAESYQHLPEKYYSDNDGKIFYFLNKLARIRQEDQK